MPTYTITDPTTKRTVKLTGDSPPSETELAEIFGTLGSATKPQPAASAPAGPRTPVAGRGSNIDLQGSYDWLGGIRAGALSTIYHGGDLIRRGVNYVMGDQPRTVGDLITGAAPRPYMERVIERPDVQAAMTPPDSPQGRQGYYGEQAAEFFLPLSRVSRAVAAEGLLTRATAEGAASAGVAGVQSGGDPKQMAVAGTTGVVLPFVGAATRTGVRAVRQAAAGAQEGGLGGAVAGAVRNVAPGEPRVMLTQALKPRAANSNWGRSVDRALPDLKAAEAARGAPVQGIQDLLETVKAAKTQNRVEYTAMAGPLREQGTTVDLTPVADEIVKRIPRKLQIMDPTRAEAITKATGVYRKRFSLEDAESLLQDTNAELEAFYAQYPGAQRAALRARPEVAQMVAEADALRTAIYSTLDAEGQGATARAVQQRYGALLDIEQEAHRRANVAARQQPESLSEQIGAVRAAADMARGGWRLAHGDLAGAADIAAAHAGRATSKAIKESQTTDALIKRAFAGYRSPTGQAAVASAAQGTR